MSWTRRTPQWAIDPAKVAFGVVFRNDARNLSRSHVRVRYGRTSEVQFVPLATFVRRCREIGRGGRSLDIEHLLVAPILKQRYASFFDRLTDWGPAGERARGLRPGEERSSVTDRRPLRFARIAPTARGWLE